MSVYASCYASYYANNLAYAKYDQLLGLIWQIYEPRLSRNIKKHKLLKI